MNNEQSESSSDDDGAAPADTLHTIGIAYTDVRREYYTTEEDFESDDDVKHRADEIASILRKLNFQVKLYKADNFVFSRLQRERPDLVVNLVESIKGSPVLASSFPAMLDTLGIPYTGTSSAPFVFTTSKFLIKHTFQQYGIPVPRSELFVTIPKKLPKTLRYPLIAKLNTHLGGSAGMDNDAVSEDESHALQRITKLMKTYKQPVLVEEFIDGGELSAIVIDNSGELEVYIGEKVFKTENVNRKFNFCSWDAVWKEEDSYTYKPFNDKKGIISDYCKKAFRAFNAGNYVKYDIRLDRNRKPYFIDLNVNCSFGPGDNAIANIPAIYGVTFTETLKKIIATAVTEKEKYNYHEAVTGNLSPTYGT